jgi:hypothetical protein
LPSVRAPLAPIRREHREYNMNFWIECALGAVICVVWFFGQYRLSEWADAKDTTFAKTVNVVSRYALAAAITLVGFSVVGAVVELLVRAIFGT